MNKVKMLVLDIDGTIFRKDYTATQRVQNTLKSLSEDGVKVVLCTGRMYAATKFIAAELGLPGLQTFLSVQNHLPGTFH